MKVGVVGEIHPNGFEVFDKNNIEYFIVSKYSDEFLIEKLRDVDGIIVRTAQINKNILSQLKNLKIVARHGVGYDNVDIKFLNQKKIAMAITGKANATSVSEHVITMMLCLTKNIFESDKLVRSGSFQKKQDLPNHFELFNKKILILGFGRIGKALAKRCNGFEMDVYIHDPFVSSKEIENLNCIPIDKEDGFKIADFISLHLPLNSTTKDLISYNEFDIFKSNMILINTARGGIVNEDALYLSLKNKKIFGAGIDVFNNEPPEENHKFFNLNNIILSPHNAALTLECRKRMSVECCENIFNFLKNRKNIIKSNIINLNILD